MWVSQEEFEKLDKMLEEWANHDLHTEIDEIWEQERIEEERKNQEIFKKLAQELD